MKFEFSPQIHYDFRKKATVQKMSDFHETWIFSTDFRKILKYQI